MYVRLRYQNLISLSFLTPFTLERNRLFEISTPFALLWMIQDEILLREKEQYVSAASAQQPRLFLLPGHYKYTVHLGCLN